MDAKWKNGCVCLMMAAAGLLAKPVVKVSVDKEGAVYECGELAVFKVVVSDDEGGELPASADFRLTNDNLAVLKTGTLDLSASSEFTMSETMEVPGFLNLSVVCNYTDQDGSAKNVKGVAAAGFSPTEIRMAAQPPLNFMEYWKGEMKRADLLAPMEPVVEKLEKYSNENHTSYKVTFEAIDDIVYGYLNIPAKPGPRPAIVYVPGAGPGHSAPLEDNEFVTLVMNVHPFDPFIENKPVGMYMFNGGNSREATFYHRVIIGIARAIEWLANRPEVDSARIGYYGSSQGGAFGLIEAGLTGRFAAVVCNVPAMCDHFGADLGRRPGWPSYRNHFMTKDAEGNSVHDSVSEAWIPYYDAAAFAGFIQCPIRVIVGFIDDTCSPSSVYAAFNAIPSEDKTMIHEIDMGHATRNSFWGDAVTWMKGVITK